MGKGMRWLNPRSTGNHPRDNAPAGDRPPASSGSDGCCVCGGDTTCSTGGDRFCSTHCPHPDH